VSLRKYHGEHGGLQHGESMLQWPGTIDGFPILSDPSTQFNLKQEEVENLDTQMAFKSRLFELWDPQQKAEFDDISDKIINGWYRLLKRSEHWDDEQKHFRIWMEWGQVYGMVPDKK